MGRAVGRGAAWMIASTIGSKIVSFGAQIALGWWLAPEHWGVFSVAISIAFVLQIFRDGGVRHLLVQRGGEYLTLSGSIFWMALAFNLATAAALIGLAPLIALAYGEPELFGLLVVIGISVPLSTVGVVLSSKLRIDLRFDDLAKMFLYSSLIRHGGSVLLAWWGMGPMAFLLPLPFVTLFDSMYCYFKTRDKPWKRPMEIRRWWELLGASKWLILMAAAMVAMDIADYAVIGLFLTAAVVGVYYFAYQLIAQTGALLATNFEQVLLPALSRLQDEPERRRQAVLRSVHALALVSAPTSLLLAALAAPVESLLWHGRWAQAVPAMQVLGLFYPARAIFVISSSYLLAVGRFKAAAMLILVVGLGRTMVALIAAQVTDDPTGLAWIIGGYVAVSCILGIAWALRSTGVGTGQLAAAIAPSWLIAAASAGLVLWIDTALAGAGAPALLRLPIGALVGGAAFILAVRTILPEHVRDAAGALPARLNPLVVRWLRL
jgi:O-antigen/teichoic acid export membrane protein